MNGYKTSQDFNLFKKLLDEGYSIIIIWRHDITKNFFAAVTQKIKGNGVADWYDLGEWTYFPGIDYGTLEDKWNYLVKTYDYKFVVPEMED